MKLLSRYADQFPQLPRRLARGRRQHRGAGRTERRRQDQSDRGDLVSRAGTRPAPRHARRGRVCRRRRLLGGLGRNRGRARAGDARHRHRTAARRGRGIDAQIPHRPRAGDVGRGVRRSSARGLAGAGDGRPVCRRTGGTPALSRSHGACGRRRTRQPHQRAGAGAALTQPAAGGSAPRYALARCRGA